MTVIFLKNIYSINENYSDPIKRANVFHQLSFKNIFFNIVLDNYIHNPHYY